MRFHIQQHSFALRFGSSQRDNLYVYSHGFSIGFDSHNWVINTISVTLSSQGRTIGFTAGEARRVNLRFLF